MEECVDLIDFAGGNPENWTAVFNCLYPVAFEAARTRLGAALTAETEDVAMETISDLLTAKVPPMSEADLKIYVGAMARNKAVSKIRYFLADKRSINRNTYLEDSPNSGELTSSEEVETLDQLTIAELHDLLLELSSNLKKEHRIVLRDHFLHGLSYKEIAEKRDVPIGSVGVFVKRGLESLRQVIAQRPQLQHELRAILTDSNLVHSLLPLATAVHFGGLLVSTFVRYNITERREMDELEAAQNHLRLVYEQSVQDHLLKEETRMQLLELAEKTHTESFEEWRIQQSEKLACDIMTARNKTIKKRCKFIGFACVFMLLAIVLLRWIQHIIA